ncbi:MAG: hypothetical protein ACAI38_03745 [Myxococcota bacterium]
MTNDKLAQALYTRLTRFNASIAPHVADIARSANAKDFDGELEKLGTASNALLNGLSGAPVDSTAALDSFAAKAGDIERWSKFPQLAGIHAATVSRTLTRIAAARPDLAPLAESVRAAVGDVRDYVDNVT